MAPSPTTSRRSRRHLPRTGWSRAAVPLTGRLAQTTPPHAPPTRRLIRNGLIVGGVVTAFSSVVSAIAYLQARVAVAGEWATPPPLDAQFEADDMHAVWCRIVWLGDSLAAGLGAISPDLSLPHLVATGRDHHTRLHVFATSGAASRDVVALQLPALQQLRYGLAQLGQQVDAIGITVGANDITSFTPRRRFRRNVEHIVATAGRDAGGRTVPIVVVSIPQLNDAIRLPHLLRTIASARAWWLDTVLRATARRHDRVHYVSVRRRPAWVRRRDIRNFLSSDRFHPSGAGYAIWASRVAEAFDLALAPEPTP